ncbi:MAG TPA: undecaprenyl-phosphate glucose phosphotransferase [Microvirga sp.]|nr:undecaprenyl-phosphate glucose phosphotransferase [Microvirga sp.]
MQEQRLAVVGEADRPGRLALSCDDAGVVAATLDAFTIVLLHVLVGAVYHHWVIDGGFYILQSLVSGVAVAVVLVTTLHGRGHYATDQLFSPQSSVWPVLLCWVLGVLLLLGAAFALKLSDSFSRGALLTTSGIGPFTLLLQRRLAGKVLASWMRSGRIRQRRILLVTEANGAEPVPLELARTTSIVGTIPLPDEADDGDIRRVGRDAVAAVRRSDVDEVYLEVSWAHWEAIKPLLQELRSVPVPVRLLPDRPAAEILLSGAVGPRSAPIELQRAPLTYAERKFKRTFDVLLSGLGLILLAPLLFLTALAIRFDSSGPILFRQLRRGFNGRTFHIYKFRSMRVMEEGDAVVQAQRNDSRVTRVGKILRKSSMDELPQLLNVLRGDMSLVGPRPHALAHDDEYTQQIERYAFRHHSKPGITGWAQVNGYRGETPTVDWMKRRVEHDLWYIANWTFWLDIWILARTVVEVVRSRNAY